MRHETAPSLHRSIVMVLGGLSLLLLATTATGCGDSEDSPEDSPEATIIEAANAVYVEDCGGAKLCSESKVATVLGSRMHYREAGNPSGKPIVLLHGQPTWSYLWRGIIPNLPADARIIAPDTIGYGFSESPDIDYTWLDQVRYVEAFIDELELTDITLVVHDMGSFQGLAYAQRNPEKIAGIVMAESVLGPFPAPEDFQLPEGPEGDGLRGFLMFLGAVRSSPAEAERLIVDEHAFVETFLDDTTVTTLSEATKNAYRAPFLDRQSLFKQIQVPLGIPMGGVPAENHAFVSDYAQYLATSDVPKLLLHGEPGFIISAQQAAEIGQMLPNTEVKSIGPGLHFIQEDQPDAIASAISQFYSEKVNP